MEELIHHVSWGNSANSAHTWYIKECIMYLCMCVSVWLYVGLTVRVFQTQTHFSIDTYFMSSQFCWNGNTVGISLFCYCYLSLLILYLHPHFLPIVRLFLCEPTLIAIVFNWNSCLEIFHSLSFTLERKEGKREMCRTKRKKNAHTHTLYIIRNIRRALKSHRLLHHLTLIPYR